MKQCNFCEPEPCKTKVQEQKRQRINKIEKWSFIALMWVATVYFGAHTLVALGVGR